VTQVNLSDIASGTGNLGFVINGVSEYDRSGTSVSSAGDVNGDGLDDLIVGAYRADPNGQTDAGASYVVFGNDTGTVTQVNLSDIANGIGGFVINGVSEYDRSGTSVSSAGDVNGDGFDDLIVGAYLADPNGRNSGASYVVFGGNFTGAVTQVGTTGSDTLSGTTATDIIFGGLGNDVITTNGGNDRLAGGPGADTFVISNGPGTVRILDFGAGDTLDFRAFGLTGDPIFTLNGSGNTQIALDADTFVIVEGYNPTELTAFLNVTINPASIVISDTRAADTTPPAAPTGLDLAAVDDSGTNNADNVTNQTSNLTITGTAEGNAQVELFNGSTSLGTTTANGSGVFTKDVTLAVGSASITAKATDAAGNVSAASAALAISVISNTVAEFGLSGIASATGSFAINGAAANDNSGTSVSSAGDVNGDGLDDLIVGARSADPNGSSSGASYVVFGKNNTNSVDLSAIASGTGGFVINGASAGNRSGSSVSSAGDVNGDGFDDLIVGANYAGPNGNYSGASYVVFGKTDGTSVNLSDIASGTSDLGFVINGASEYDYSGRSVSSAGDVNGDGLDDLIVGAPFVGLSLTGNEGVSYVVFGKTDGTSVNLSDIASGTSDLGFVINGAAANDLSGASVSSAGDVNGDGLDDLIVGAPGFEPTGATPGPGKSYVVFGKNNTNSVELSAIATGTGGFVINGVSGGDRSGRSVSSAGDVNGDGLDDLIVGAPYADPSGATPSGTTTDAGKSYVVFGKTTGTSVDLSAIASGTGGFVINGVAADDRSGGSVSSAGDVNGDGFDDLIVGARTADLSETTIDAGKSYVVFGKTDGTSVNLSAIASGTGNLGFVINGALTDGNLGNSVSSAGDVNGDGFDDLIVGADYADPNGAINAGASYVVFGGNFTGAVTQVGTTGNDTLSGTTATDIIFGGLGNDVITTNGGSDRLAGGPGADTFVISNGPGTVRILDFGAGDTLDFRAFGLSSRPNFTLNGSGNTQIALDTDTFVIVEGYNPTELTAFLNNMINSASMVIG
jgi:hypothetical protein